MRSKRNHSGRIEVRPALQYLTGLKFAWRRAYEAACKHDGIDPTAKFAVFSDSNPFTRFVDRAAGELFDGLRQYQAGGYVGLQIQNGRAQ